ncbi:MAG: ATP-binding cassette domain-containing protein [Bifidobacteriaceae bacterium]|jgi:putative ABC transport system permease protein|nr:ATP-binding cassette domain-containing protein [Bifidobacteriaceae bacterium]
MNNENSEQAVLQLRNVTKSYKIGEIVTHALNGVTIDFRPQEFVAILGASGSGKTTLLNIIGGLDRYDSGELLIKGKNTKNFKNKEWDAYRNNSIGFVFQSYNLISHINIIKNVEMSLTLTGTNRKTRRAKAIEVLKRVGLGDHLHKKPSQLSGGQMQRVAIARALVNDPEILLCDEPTGALDSETSVQILELIKEVASDRLVIMVTHNQEIADEYAKRIIRVSDGKIQEDTSPFDASVTPDQFQLKKTRMSFWNALGLSFTNILTKKGRTFLTAFASSIGIIGIGLVLSLSNGFQEQVDIYERDTLAGFPVLISRQTVQIDEETMMNQQNEMEKRMMGTGDFTASQEVYLRYPDETSIRHENKLDNEYLEYVEKIDPAVCDLIGVTRVVNLNLLGKVDGKVKSVSFGSAISMGEESSNSSGSANLPPMATGGGSNISEYGLSSYPASQDGTYSFLAQRYDVLAGELPTSDFEFVLIVDTDNQLNAESLESLGFDFDKTKTVGFDDIVGHKIKWIPNDVWYEEMTIPMTDTTVYTPNPDLDQLYDNADAKTLTLSAIVRVKPDMGMSIMKTGPAYSDGLTKWAIEQSQTSEIVKAQEDSKTNVLSGQDIDEETKSQLLMMLGNNDDPYLITMFASNFDAKDQLREYLNEWNTGKADSNKIIYTDMAERISEMSGGIMTAITYVLVGFSAISLIVSLIMVAIIIYTSVLERKKEIGILKALGARNKDITRVFTAETFIIGSLSGLLGIGIAYLLTIPISNVIYDMTELENVANLPILYAAALFGVSLVLTLLAGWTPAKMAACLDPVVALRDE